MSASAEELRVIDSLTTRATTDEAFRKQLLADPRGSIEQIAGHPLPSDFNIKFIEKDANVDALIVLPDLVAQHSDLSVEELEAVAGGGDCWVCSDCLLTDCLVTNCCGGTADIVVT
jgi:hypothetical protein